jgi:hypothetical protein
VPVGSRCCFRQILIAASVLPGSLLNKKVDCWSWGLGVSVSVSVRVSVSVCRWALAACRLLTSSPSTFGKH